MSINEFMSHKHRECDDVFSQAENFVAEGKWDEAYKAWQEFYHELDEHLTMEEAVLFPRFEEATGMTQGPTSVMRMEHVQMREMCDKLSSAALAKDQDQFLGLSETLMILMQQHNMKEEQVLYPMTDRVLGDSGSIIQAMENHGNQ